jgi:hypothetical protein
MAAVILAFRRPPNRGTILESRRVDTAADWALSEANVTGRPAGQRPERVALLSVPEAAFATFFVSLDPKNSLEAISRLTGVTLGELHGLWRGPRGLRQAALRYALDEVMD